MSLCAFMALYLLQHLLKARFPGAMAVVSCTIIWNFSVARQNVTSCVHFYSEALKVQTSWGNYLSSLSVHVEQVDFDDPDLWKQCMDDLILKAVIWQDDHWVDWSALLKVEQLSEWLKGAVKVMLLSLDRNHELSLFSFPFTALIEGVIHQYKPSEHET